jgi:hypothetical protein
MEPTMPEVGLTGFLSALAQSVAGNVVAKDKLNFQKHLLDEDITRLAESAAFIWKKTVEEYKGQEHELVSEFLGAEPEPLELVAASHGCWNSKHVPAESSATRSWQAQAPCGSGWEMLPSQILVHDSRIDGSNLAPAPF